MDGCSRSKSSKQQKKVNKQINKQIRKDKKEYLATHRILVLGEPGSGKSTIRKQIQIIHGAGITTAEKLLSINTINRIMCDGIRYIVGRMLNLSPPVSLEYPIENEARLKRLWKITFPVDSTSLTQFYEDVELIWRDKEIQAGVQQSRACEFLGSTVYFLNRVFIIKRHNYLPTEQDVLRCSGYTDKQFLELRFKMDDFNFQILSFSRDYWRYKHLREAYGQCLAELRAVIYVVDCSTYDKKFGGNETELHYSIHCYERFWKAAHSRRGTGILLLMNKSDIFEEKLRSGKSRLQTYFPEFSKFQTPLGATPIIPEEDPEFTRAKYFIRNKFQQVRNQNLSDEGGCMNYCYTYFTCALNADNIRHVFAKFKDALIGVYLFEAPARAGRCVFI